MSDSSFVSIHGTVEFDPQTRDVQGKEVTDVTMRATHNQAKYRVTFWPNLKDEASKIVKGSVLTITGKGSKNTVNGNDGPVTYNNVSAFGIKNHGALTLGEKPATDNAPTGDGSDDDIPF